MTKAEFRQAIKRNGLSCDDFAEIAGRCVRTVYAFGEETPVPYYARLILRLLDERGGGSDLIRRK